MEILPSILSAGARIASAGVASMWFDGVDESQLVGSFTGGEFPGNPFPTGSPPAIKSSISRPLIYFYRQPRKYTEWRINDFAAGG